MHYFTNTLFPLDTDVCLSSPCENGGTCLDETISTCACVQGYAGKHCETSKCSLIGIQYFAMDNMPNDFEKVQKTYIKVFFDFLFLAIGLIG